MTWKASLDSDWFASTSIIFKKSFMRGLGTYHRYMSESVYRVKSFSEPKGFIKSVHKSRFPVGPSGLRGTDEGLAASEYDASVL